MYKSLSFILLIFGNSLMSFPLGFPPPSNRFATFETNEPGIKRKYLLQEFRICAEDLSSADLKAYLKKAVENNCLPSGVESVVGYTPENDTQPSLEGVSLSNKVSLHATYWQKQRLLVVNVTFQDCDFLSDTLVNLTRDSFGLIEKTSTCLEPENAKQENPKVKVKTNHDLGRALVATYAIKKGDFIGGLYGKFHEAKDCMSLPDQYRDHVMQCAPHLWRGNVHKDEAVQYLNHSCDPNCGVYGLVDFVAMRDIKQGEELTTDYAMQDDSNWVVPGGKCLCESDKCRGKILPFGDLKKEEQDELAPYTSHWILHKYNRCTCPKKP